MSFITKRGEWIANYGTQWKADIIDTDSNGVSTFLQFSNQYTYSKHVGFWQVGTTYKIQVTVTNYSGSGNIIPPWDGTGSNKPSTINANGTYTYNYTPVGLNVGVVSEAGLTAKIVINSITELGSTINMIPHFEQVVGNAFIYNGSSIEDVRVMQGFSLDYDSGNTDVKYKSIVKSSIDLPLFNDGSLNTFSNDLQTSPENRFIIKLYKNGSFYWAGVVLQDFGGHDDSDREIITLTATDGIALLKNVEAQIYVNHHILYMNILKYLRTALRSISYVDEIWTLTDDFILELMNWHTTKQNNNQLLLNTYINAAIFEKVETTKGYNGVEYTTIVPQNWYEILEMILIHFNARIMLADGKWQIIQYEVMTATSRIGKIYNKSNTTTSSTTKILKKALSSDLKRADGNFTYLPGLKSVVCKYLTNETSNLLPKNMAFDTWYTMRFVTAATGNYLRLIGEIIFTTLTLVNDEYAYYKFYIKVGNYYYTSAGWSTTVGFYEVVSSASFTGQAFTNWDFTTTDFPTDGDIEFKIVFDSSQGLGNTTIYPPYYHAIQSADILLILDNKTEADYIKLQSINSENYTLTHEVDNNLFGTSGTSANKGHLMVMDTTANALVYSDDWGVDGGPYDKNVNELLVGQILKQQKQPLLVFNGSVIMLNSWIDISNSIEFDYNGLTYIFVANKITYKDDVWSGDWQMISVDGTGISTTSTEIKSASDVNLATLIPQLKREIAQAQATADSKWTYDGHIIDLRADTRITQKVGTDTEIANLRSGFLPNGNCGPC